MGDKSIVEILQMWVPVIAVVLFLISVPFWTSRNFVKKHAKYLHYVVVHKWYVFVECVRIGGRNGNLATMTWRGVWHDMSKFYPDEWFPYVEYFNGSWRDNLDDPDDHNCPDDILYGFNTAWAKHIHRNPHHWQHWILNKDNGGTVLIDMPDKYIVEMFCDWTGAGKMWGKDDVKPWYDKNWEKQQMSVSTRSAVDILVGGG